VLFGDARTNLEVTWRRKIVLWLGKGEGSSRTGCFEVLFQHEPGKFK